MPRDYTKTEYWMVPVDRNSELYRAIMNDASEVSMISSIPVLIRIRLGEYYAQKRNRHDIKLDTKEGVTTNEPVRKTDE